MDIQVKAEERTIAVLDVDGENFVVRGVYQGGTRKPSSYIVTRSGDRRVSVRDLSSFPSHQQLRELMN
jgi:capsid protein